MGIFGKNYYSQTMTATGAPGTRARAAGYDHRPAAINPLLAMLVTIAIGGVAADGDYAYKITDEDGNAQTVTFTRAGGETNAQIATALAGKHNGASWVNDAFTASVDTATITLTGLHPGKTYTVTEVTKPGGATITISTTQAAGGSPIAPGAFVARKTAANPATGASDEVRNLKTGDTLAAVWGLAEQVAIPREIDEDGDLDRDVRPGEAVAPATSGHYWVTSETALAAGATPYVRVVATGNERAGLLRNDADGGDAVDASSICKVITGTDVAGGTVEVSINIQP